MAAYALESAPYPGANGTYKKACLLPVVVAFAAGAPSIVTARSAAGFTIADGATGAYTGTAPKAARGIIQCQVLAPTGADSDVVTVTSYDPTTGVFALQAHVNAAPADLADGSELWLLFLLEGG
jgi:hypothetical protein